MDLLEIGTIQISEKRRDAIYLPYALSLLQSYVQGQAPRPERYRFRLPYIHRAPVSLALSHLEGVQIAAFSVYIWNLRRSLALAKALKERQPETLIIFGGPQVPTGTESAEALLRQAPWVDVLVQGEGEQVFLALLEAFPSNDWSEIPGLAYLSDGTFVQHPQGPRLQVLDTIPSPFLTGYFEPLMASLPESKWVAIWETNRGCPFSCAFCDWGGLLQSRVYRFDEARVHREIEWFAAHKIETVYSADANFGMLPRDMQIVEKMAAVRDQTGWPKQFQTQTAKNVRKRNLEIQRTLAEHDLNHITSLALQSLHPPVLEAIRRQNISLEVYEELHRFCLQQGIFSYTDFIVGLPDETYESFANGISQVIAMGQHNGILFHNASILPNAEMATPEYRREYGLKTLMIPFPGHTEIDEIQEQIEIVIGSRTASTQDWVRMQALAWMTNFLYYTFKPLQIAFMVLHSELGLSYRELLEAFCLPHAGQTYPTVTRVYCTMLELAQRYASGEPNQDNHPLLFSPQEGIHLTPDHMLQRYLARQGLWPRFFREAEHLLLRLAFARDRRADTVLLQEALKLSQAHFLHRFFGKEESNRLPGMRVIPHEMQLRYNLWEFYEASMWGRDGTIQKKVGRFRYLAPESLPSAPKTAVETQALELS